MPRGRSGPARHNPGMTNLHKGQTGLGRLVRATGYSLDGLRTAYLTEGAFRQETWAALALLPASVWLGSGDWVRTGMLAGSVLLVLIVELLNSSLEAVVDRVSLDPHALSKRAKDLGSAAVFLSVLSCAGLWCAAAWSRFHG